MFDDRTFSDIGVCPALCQAVNRLKWEHPTKIQAATIPQALRGENVAGMAETGSGKTGAYLIPVIQRLLTNEKPRKYAVVLAPTRELVQQIAEVAAKLCEGENIDIAMAYGGVDDVAQMAELAQNPHIIIATPGRLAQLVTDAKGFKLASVRMVVVDEADKMATITFYENISVILSKCAKERQLLLFSATMPQDVERLADLSVSKASVVKLGSREQVPQALTEYMMSVRNEKKEATLAAILEEYQTMQFVVFTTTCRVAQVLTDTLKNLNFSVGAAHGRMEQSVREEQIALFKAGELRILVSTNVAGRGLDIPNIDVVVNYDVPDSPKEYIHRSGRAGRASREGIAITFVNKEDLPTYLKLEKFLKRKLEQKTIDEDDLKHWSALVVDAKDQAVQKYKVESRQQQRT